MLKTFLKEVITIVVGKQAEDIIDMLDGKKYVNEFIIAKKLGITINQTRNILYKIADHGLISSIRKKDKRKGWYTYFWKIEVLKSLEFLSEIVSQKIIQLKNQVKSRESKEFYVCSQCNIEVNQENALLHDFTCNECGEVYTLKDNTKLLRELKKEISKLESKLKLIQLEVNKEQEKLDKQRLKEIKKEEKEKARKKAIAAAKRKATRKKLQKEKSTTKKKIVKKKASVKKKVAKKKPVKKKATIKKKVVKKKALVKKKIVKKKSIKTSKSSKRKK